MGENKYLHISYIKIINKSISIEQKGNIHIKEKKMELSEPKK